MNFCVKQSRIYECSQIYQYTNHDVRIRIFVYLNVFVYSGLLHFNEALTNDPS